MFEIPDTIGCTFQNLYFIVEAFCGSIGDMGIFEGVQYLYVNGKIAQEGLYQLDGEYYCSYWNGALVTDKRYYVSASFCDLPAKANYTFGSDGAMLNGIVEIDGKFTPSPFNNKTIDDFFDEEKSKRIKDRLKEVYGNCNKVTIVELLESEDELIKEYANFLFEKDYRPYTSKQWGIKPEELDISILKRE